MPKLKYIALLLALVFLPAVARAEHDTVTHSSNISIYLSDRGQSYTLDATSQLESYSVDTGTVSFVVSSGSLFQLSYAGKVKFVPSAHTCTETNIDCDATNSYVSITCGTITGTPTITVSVSSCGGGSDGGGGGGSGGDTTPPASTSVVINSNAVSTSNVNVTLALSASDTSLPMYMMVANDGAFIGRSWEGYSVIKSWTLASGAGTKTVYAKFKDSAGNVSSAVSDAITLLGAETTPPVVTPTTPTPAPTPTPTPTLAPITPTPTEVSVAAPEITGVTLSAPESAVQVVSLPKYSYQPNETLKFSYKYKNEGAKMATIKITRQLLDSKGKVVKTSVATKSLKKGATFIGSVQETISKTLKPGTYTERIRVLDVKSKTLDENSFVINVEKLKSKVFAIGEVLSLSSDLAFDGAVLSKVKTNVKLPTSIKLKYSYTNSTDKKHTVKMVRQLIDGKGKVLQTSTGKWAMKVGEKYAQSFTQSLASSLSAGDYTVKITAYDWTTKEFLGENSIGFSVALK